MDQFSLKMKLLLDITLKKKNVISTILNITENQNCILNSKQIDSYTLEMFRLLASEKQKSIDEVIKLDTVFQRTFDSISSMLNGNLTENQKVYLESLQLAIDEVIYIDEKIRKFEKTNNAVAELKEAENKASKDSKIHVPKMDKNTLMEHYKRNNRLPK